MAGRVHLQQRRRRGSHRRGGAWLTLTPQSADYWRAWTAGLGAVVVGRELFDLTGGWRGTHPLGVPVVVLTHEPPTDWDYPGAENFSFVSDGIEAAVALAQQVAGKKNVGVAAGTIARQCLEAGLLDEVAVDLVPVVMGKDGPISASCLTVTHTCWATQRHSFRVSGSHTWYSQ
jgi:dihydrofolate reductase